MHVLNNGRQCFEVCYKVATKVLERNRHTDCSDPFKEFRVQGFWFRASGFRVCGFSLM